MKFYVVLKQIKLNILILQLSEICWIKEKSFSFTNGAKKL